jgi:protein disulfide-isomerase A6
VELVALNGKRSWYRHYPKTSFSQAEVEDWIDSIRMGEGSKEKVPEGLIMERGDLPPEPVYLESDKFDKSSKEAMKESIKEQMPDGVEFEVDEIDDDEYEKIIAQAAAEAKKREEKEKVEEVDKHDEL